MIVVALATSRSGFFASELVSVTACVGSAASQACDFALALRIQYRKTAAHLLGIVFGHFEPPLGTAILR